MDSRDVTQSTRDPYTQNTAIQHDTKANVSDTKKSKKENKIPTLEPREIPVDLPSLKGRVKTDVDSPISPEILQERLAKAETPEQIQEILSQIRNAKAHEQLQVKRESKIEARNAKLEAKSAQIKKIEETKFDKEFRLNGLKNMYTLTDRGAVSIQKPITEEEREAFIDMLDNFKAFIFDPKTGNVKAHTNMADNFSKGQTINVFDEFGNETEVDINDIEVLSDEEYAEFRQAFLLQIDAAYVPAAENKYEVKIDQRKPPESTDRTLEKTKEHKTEEKKTEKTESTSTPKTSQSRKAELAKEEEIVRAERAKKKDEIAQEKKLSHLKGDLEKMETRLEELKERTIKEGIQHDELKGIRKDLQEVKQKALAIQKEIQGEDVGQIISKIDLLIKMIKHLAK